MKYLNRLTGKVYNTDTAKLVKCAAEIEELGDGWVRNVMKRVMKNDIAGYFVYVNKVTTDRCCNIVDESEYIVPVTEEWAMKFRRGTPDVWPY